MGGRGYHKNVKGYLHSNKRTAEYSRISEISSNRIDFIVDTISTIAPVAPEFSNSPNKIYVLLDKNLKKIKNITVYDENHEQLYSIHLDHFHDGKNEHVHLGINQGRNIVELTKEHQKIIDEVRKIFEEWRKK